MAVIEKFHAWKSEDSDTVAPAHPKPAASTSAYKFPGLAKFKPLTHKLGGIGELTVCANLLRSGFGVFRAVADHEDCDIIATKGGKTWRVEVRTCRRTPGGKIYYPKGDPAKHDVLAAVDHFGAITYIPPFELARHSVMQGPASGHCASLDAKSPPAPGGCGCYAASATH